MNCKTDRKLIDYGFIERGKEPDCFGEEYPTDYVGHEDGGVGQVA